MQEEILIISDNIALIDAIEAILIDEGYLLFNGMHENVILHFEENMPQLILLDIDLKCKNGSQLYQKIKNSKLSNLPVIIFSNKRLNFITDETDLIIEKPFELTKFLIAVNDFINGSVLLPAKHIPENQIDLI